MGPGIAREQSELLEPLAQFTIELHQSASDSQTRRAGLAGNTAAVGENQHIELIGRLGCEQRLAHRNALRFGLKIRIERPAVHFDLTLAGSQEHASHRSLSPAR